MEQSENHRIVFVSASSVAQAKDIATVLVREKLAACCTILNGAESVYLWQGAIEQSQEVQMIIKTDGLRLEAIEKRIIELHNYEIPEILVVRVEAGSQKYLQWMKESLSS